MSVISPSYQSLFVGKKLSLLFLSMSEIAPNSKHILSSAKYHEYIISFDLTTPHVVNRGFLVLMGKLRLKEVKSVT